MTPFATSAPGIGPLVAREHLLQRLWSEVAASAAQGMRAAVVRGPAGSGKTRVLEAFAERARSGGATVMPGRSAAVGGHPYAALGDALAAYVRGSAPAAGQLRAAGAALPALVPALGHPADPPGRPDSLAVVQALFALVRQITGRRPLVVVVDDAHLADTETCEALSTLARHAADLPWTLVLGWRDPAGESSQAARRFLDQLRRERAAVELGLDPLDSAAAGELVAALIGDGLPAPGLVDALHVRSAGNPYHLTEMVRWLRDTGRLRRTGLQWVAVPGSEEELPPSIEEALRERMAGLSVPARSVLEWLAVGGGDHPLALIGEVSGLDEPTLAAALDELDRSGMATSVSSRRADYRIQHPLVGESAYREMGPARRRLAHRAFGDALERRGAGVGAVAGHRVRAADPGDAQAITTVLAAAQEAEAGIHVSQAAAWYEQVLELTVSPEDPARLLALDRLSDIAVHSGRVEAGTRAVEELLARAGDDQVRRVTLLRRLATARVVAGDSDGAREAIEEGLARAAAAGGAAGGQEAARLLAELAMVAQMTLPVDELLAVVVRGREAARAAGAAGPEVVCRAFEAIAIADLGDPGRGAELALAAGRDAAAAGEVVAFGYAVVAGALCEMVAGRFDSAITALTALLPMVDEVGLLWGAAWAHSLMGQALHLTGDVPGSLQACLRAEELARRSHSATVVPLPVVGVASALAVMGRRELALERLAEARGLLDEVRVPFFEPWYWQGCGLVAELDGDWEAAAGHYQRLADAVDRRGDVAQAAMKARLVAALARAGRAADALERADAILRVAEERDMPLALASVGLARALALSRAGRLEEAVDAAQDALQLSGQIDGQLLRTQACAVLGEVLVAAGRRGEGRDRLLEAHAGFAAMGFEVERTRLAVLLAPLGVPARALQAAPEVGPAAVPAGPLDPLSPREREVADLASTGLSSRSVALRLGVSERTVENHLQHIYAKLGLHSRAELIALVAGTA